MSVSGSEFVDITCVVSSGSTGLVQFMIVQSSGVDSSYSAGNLTCKICAGTSCGVTHAMGVLQNDPDTGEAAIVRVLGVSKIIASDAIAVNAAITSTTAGLAVTATSGTWVIGRAESASTAANQVISARIWGGGFTYNTLSTA